MTFLSDFRLYIYQKASDGEGFNYLKMQVNLQFSGIANPSQSTAFWCYCDYLHSGPRLARGGWQNPRGPECSEGPGNLGKMFVYWLSSAISRGTGAVFTNRHFVLGPVVGSPRPCSGPRSNFTIGRAGAEMKQVLCTLGIWGYAP
jgi:hypothetical protein